MYTSFRRHFIDTIQKIVGKVLLSKVKNRKLKTFSMLKDEIRQGKGSGFFCVLSDSLLQ